MDLIFQFFMTFLKNEFWLFALQWSLETSQEHKYMV